MRYVVDASVAVKWLVVEEGAEIAKELAVDGHDLHAPRLMASEVASSLWRKARMGELERNSVGALLAQVPNMPVRWGADETLSADAVRLALALNHPVYDCIYLALAQRIGAVLVTADSRFAKVLAPTGHGESVMTLAQYLEME